jgi:FkbH-like protein
MKLTEALRLLQAAPNAPLWRADLVCGFTPLHFATWLHAHLQQRLPARRVGLHTGLFGDWAGNLERAAAARPAAIVAVLEWEDIDPRLGPRQLGGWLSAQRVDIETSAAQRLAQFTVQLGQAAAQAPVTIALPTLPLPPAAHTTPLQMSVWEANLRALLAQFSAQWSQIPGVFLLSSQWVDELSPAATRFDPASCLQTGFPYAKPHAELLASALASLAVPPPPKKGIITDLDDTLWSGIAGEAGPDGVHWDLEHHAQPHGLYQQLLASLAESGVLVAVASKNEPEVVRQVFARPGMCLPAASVFPFQVHWNPKSQSVEAILKAWNIGADSVVFIDDSPMEAAEVAAAFPEIETIRFPTGDARAVWQLLHHLRARFGKSTISEEDRIRSASLRQAAPAVSTDPEAFLAGAEARLEFHFSPGLTDPRPLELINKTNQFNLNGRRLTEDDWRGYLRTPGHFAAVVGYSDKYGPLGKIAVLAGRAEAGELHLDSWVLSCRAFSRRIEHLTLAVLFERFGASAITFDAQATERNQPMRQLWTDLSLPFSPAARLEREAFAALCPALPHQKEIFD